MKVKIILTISLLISLNISGQISKDKAKKDLTIRRSVIDSIETSYKEAKKTFESLSKKLSPKTNEQFDLVLKLKGTLDSLYREAIIAKEFYRQNKIPLSDLNSYIKLLPDNQFFDASFYKEPVKEKINNTPRTFFLFGKDTPISKDDLFLKDTLTKQIFSNILNDSDNLHLGNFWFPRDNQKIPLLSHTYIECKKLIKKNSSEKAWKALNSRDGKCGKEEFVVRELGFDNVKISLYEGSLVDIKVTLKDEQGSVYLFENKLSVSLLYYPKTSQRTFLRNVLQRTYKDNERDYSRFKLRLSEVLRYVSEPGGNYVPDDQNFTFPKRQGVKNTNEQSTNIYELYQSTSLQNVIDIRTYTDAQSLFGDSASGIAQFEGNASFFVNPYTIKSTPFYFFKKINPYVSYARFDEDDRSLDVTQDGTEIKLTNRLDHLQKTFLDLGFKADILSFTLGKEYPFEINLFNSIRYQIAEIEVSPENPEDYKSLGVGWGLNFKFKRYDNLSFNYSLEFTKYNHKSYNNIESFVDSGKFWVLRNEAEAAFHTNKKGTNAVFLRMRVFNDIGSIDANFFQFQFGYKFSLGIEKVKTKQ